ncbi:MAG: hypothetical protein AB7E42_10295 [Anaerotignaceae bacterium]
MGKWDALIKTAEENMKQKKKENFIETELSCYLSQHSIDSIPDRKKAMQEIEVQQRERIEHASALGKFEPKEGTIIVEHEHGFIFMDLEGFKSLSKTQQTKILKLGGK